MILSLSACMRRWCLGLGLCGLLVGPIGLIVGVSCLLCSSALPGVWSFLRVTPCMRPKSCIEKNTYIYTCTHVTHGEGNTQESKQRSTQQRTIAGSSANLTKPNDTPTHVTHYSMSCMGLLQYTVYSIRYSSLAIIHAHPPLSPPRHRSRTWLRASLCRASAAAYVVRCM